MGKITGTRAKDLIKLKGEGYKKSFYEFIAERVALPPDGENLMDRGVRLQEDAIKRFEKETKKKVETGYILWLLEEDDNIGVSPDGVIGKSEAIETKCLNSATHIEAWLTQKMPKEHHFQVLQYFIVNPQLKKLYFVFYDPRIPAKDFFYLTVNRKDLLEEIEKHKLQQLEIIKEVERITLELSKF